MPSACPPQSQYASLNVRHVYVRAAHRGWDNTVDHSKWAVTIPPPEVASNASELGTNQAAQSQQVVCIGDMNRMQAQLLRGGGALCFMNNTALWQAFRSLIYAIEGCHAQPIS